MEIKFIQMKIDRCKHIQPRIIQEGFCSIFNCPFLSPTQKPLTKGNRQDYYKHADISVYVSYNMIFTLWDKI